MGEDVVVRMRPPRYIHPELGLKPYSRYQAVGLRLMKSVNKGRYSNSGDIYWAHAPLSKEEKADVVLITDKLVTNIFNDTKIWGVFILF